MPGLARRLLFVQPGRRADLGAAAEGAIVAGHLLGPGVTPKHLAGEIGAEAAVLEPAAADAAAKDGTVALARLAQLVATATAVVA